MVQVGYGVMVNNKPSGLWPRSLQSAIKYARQEDKGTQRASVVPVFIGAPISLEGRPKLEPIGVD